MTEESMMSTAESGYGPTYGYGYDQGGGAVQAEMITKKLANYWCLIGSIPLVLFLLVAIPTIFFVKRFSDYVNAYYCDTKSCKDIADAIQAAGSITDACGSLSKAACPSKQKSYILQLWSHMIKEIKDPQTIPASEDAPTPPGLEHSLKYRALGTLCQGLAIDENPVEAIFPQIGLKLGIGDQVDTQNHGSLSALSGTLAALGMDGLVRAVAILVDNGTHKALELSAPIKDMYPTMLMDIFNKKYKDLIAGLEADEPFLPDFPDTFARLFADYLLDKTSKVEDNMPIVVTQDELVAKDNPAVTTWSWKTFFDKFHEVAKNVPKDAKIRLSHPTYFLGLRDFLNITETLPGAGNVMLQLNAFLHVVGPMAFSKKDRSEKPYLCFHWADRVLPGASSAAFFESRTKQFGANTGIVPGLKNASAMIEVLSKEVQEVLDSMALSFSLSVSAPESARTGFYRLTKKMSRTPGAFYANSTRELDSDLLSKILFGNIVEDSEDVIGIAADAKLHWASKYWEYTPELLKFREPMGSTQIYASYSPTEENLFVPMGVFTKPFYRNTKHNRAFTALGGYAVIAGLMHALTAYGGSVVKGDLYPVPWAGFSWVDKMVKFQNCMRAQRKENGSLFNAMDQYMLGAVSPSYRYYRRAVLKVAYPRPEFRIDWISDYSSTQIFFYTWAMMHCGTPSGKKLIDLAAKNNKYFHEGFACESKLNPHRCQLWESSRRNY